MTEDNSIKIRRIFPRSQDIEPLVGVTRRLAESLRIPLREAVDVVSEWISRKTPPTLWKISATGGLPEEWENVDRKKLILSFFNSYWWDEEYTTKRETTIGQTREAEIAKDIAVRKADANSFVNFERGLAKLRILPRPLSYQMVNVVELANQVAARGAISLEEALGHIWQTTVHDESFFLYELGNGMPSDIGPAAFNIEFIDRTGLDDRASDMPWLAQYAFTPADAQEILNALPTRDGQNSGEAVNVGGPNGHADTTRGRKRTDKVEELHEAIQRREGEAQRQRAQSPVMTLAKNNTKDFIRWCCQLILNPEDVKNPLETVFPFKKGDREFPVPFLGRFAYLAEITSRKLSVDAEQPKLQAGNSTADFITLHDEVFERFLVDDDSYRIPRIFEGSRSRVEFLLLIFDYLKEPLVRVLADVTEKIYHGVPIYQRNSQGEMSRVLREDENYTYLRGCGRHGGMVECFEPPGWMKSYYFSRTELRIYALLFNFDKIPTEAQLSERRAVLAKQLDLGTQLAPSQDARVKPATLLLGLVDVVRARWYAEHFDPLDRDTFPKQTDVVEWLMANHQLSKRQAEAVDIVTRPDQARRP